MENTPIFKWMIWGVYTPLFSENVPMLFFRKAGFGSCFRNSFDWKGSKKAIVVLFDGLFQNFMHSEPL